MRRLLVDENGKNAYRFYDLDLERSHVESLPMNWTVVHPLNSESPLFEYSSEDMKTADLEIYVSVRGFDDVYSNIVQQRTSYTFSEILFEGNLFRCTGKVMTVKRRSWS